MFASRTLKAAALSLLLIGAAQAGAAAPLSLYEIVTPEKSAGAPALVALNPSIFDTASWQPGRALLMPGPTGVPQAATVNRVDAQAPGRFAVHGALNGAAGHFVLTVRDGACALTIIGEETYHLKGSPAGHVLETKDPAAETCGVDHLPQFFARPGEPLSSPPGAKDGEPALIDVMVLYTPAARAVAGSAANIEAEIQNAVNLANGAYLNSGIGVVLSLAYTGEVDYTEELSLAITLARLTFDNDGVLDEVHTLRDAHDADMVALVTAGGDVCGIGWIIEDLHPLIAQQAFSVTNYYCLGGYTFAHELGHNMGCAHDQQNLTAEGYRLFNYSRGWRYTAANNSVLCRTVMAYPPGVRIPYFSNPDISFQGTPTGVPLGHPDEAHNALTINASAPQIALNRPLAAEGEGEGETEYEGYYCEKLGALYNNALLRQLLPGFAGPLFDLLNPEIADVNGGADPDTLTVLGNGMLDCAFELGVLRRLEENTAYDASAFGGVTHAMVANALTVNRAQIEADLGPVNVAVVDSLAPALLDLAVAYMTLGDEGSVGFIQALFDVINDIQFIGTLSVNQYVRLEEFLGADGDADGDGFTNRQEYEAYALFGGDIYVNFALDPGVFPGGEGEGEGEGEGPGAPVIVGPASVTPGEDVTLTVQAEGLVGEVNYAWTKDGDTILESSEPTLFLPAVTETDEGFYQVVVTDEAKAVRASAPFYLEVAALLPLGGVFLLALLLLSGVCVVFAAARPRRGPY